ncbi:MAG: hypothetical protein E6Q76_06875 [Rhizobium sp.]|nr:MAG: hypothetical protein E6Q76_06875 [Rhizobium sp.]
MTYLASFFAGAFLCNCLPHLVAGLQGMPFPTPFATPRGVGNSSPFLNFLWGCFNLAVGLALGKTAGIEFEADFKWVAAAAGVLALGSYLSLHFGKVRSVKDR